MGAAPQETSGLWEDRQCYMSWAATAGQERALLHFSFLGNRVCPAEALLTCRRPCTSEYGAAEPQGDLRLSSEDTSPGWVCQASEAAPAPGMLGLGGLCLACHRVAGRLVHLQADARNKGSVPQLLGTLPKQGNFLGKCGGPRNRL